MSNSIIPHFVSDSPPPIANNDVEDYDDEFGDFTGPGDLSFDNDLSIPSTPKISNNFTRNYDFEFNKLENKYERNIKTEDKDKSTNNFIRNELPTKNYINILDHIENNALKIVVADGEDILKHNDEVDDELTKSDIEKVPIKSKLEENGENFTEFTESPEEIKMVGDGLSISYIVSTEKPDIVNSSDEDELIKTTDISNFSVLLPEKSSGIVDHVFNSKEYSADFPTLKSDNTNLQDELGTNRKESITVDVSKEVIHQNEDSVDNGNVEQSICQDVSKEEKIVKYGNETLNYINVQYKSIDDNGAEIHSEKINKIINCQATSNDIMNNDEEIHGYNANNLKSHKSDSSFQILHSTLEVETSQLASCEATGNYGEDDDFSEFTDFKTSNLVTGVTAKTSNLETDHNNVGVKTSNFDTYNNDVSVKTEIGDGNQVDNFAEFGDFESCIHDSNLKDSLEKMVEKNKQDNVESKKEVVECDDFDDFADYSTFSKPNNNDDDDDFDNFCDYSAFNRQSSEREEISGSNIKICKGADEAFEQSQIVLEDVFVRVESESNDYINCDITLGNSVFENLKDITETNALMYQWEKSTSQKNILKTLNIDIRNILYGPTWNAGIPIFAANLCSTPLEPIKSEVTCTPSPHRSERAPEANRFNLPTEVPLAEFDWNTAGLTNPLDSLEIEDKESKTSDLSKVPNRGIGIPYINSGTARDVKPTRDRKTNGSVESIAYTNEVRNCEGVQQVEENEEDFSDFTSYQPNFEQNLPWTGKMLPLRESHIACQASSTKESLPNTHANVAPSVENAPTNFTLLESKTAFTELNLTSLSKPVDYSVGTVFYQMESKSTEPITSFEEIRSFKIEPNNQEYNKLHNKEIKSIAAAVSSESFDAGSQTTEVISKMKEIQTKQTLSIQVEQSDQDDEFTDFHSSLPNQVHLPHASTLSFPEPLKPAVLQPVPVNSIAKIEWPEPGLDEDEVSRIVAGVLRRKSETETEIVRKNEPAPYLQEKIEIKNATEPQIDIPCSDDDEWSDFVSVKEPSISRTGTPDLPLSVFNLGSVQPVKVPTPVLTPNGLICSPMKNTLPNISVPKSNIYLQRNIQHNSQKHPFITSQAFDALYQNPRKNIGFVNNSFSELPRQITHQSHRNSKDQKTNIFDTHFDTTAPNVSSIGYIPQQNERMSYGELQSSPLRAAKSSEDDEEWGDFVSATSSIPTYNSNLNSQHSSTRIITNPSHFMGIFNKNVSTDQYSSSNKSTVVRQEKRNIPSISALPDLDFVSPRTRTAKK